MKWTRFAVIVVFFVALSGCSSKDAVKLGPKADKEKAAAINAEMGMRYMQQGNMALAKEKLERSLAISDDNADAHHYYAVLNQALGQYDVAEEHFDDALSMDSDNSALQNNYGVFLHKTGEYENAEKSFKKVLQDPVYPTPELVWENLGINAIKMERLDAAEKFFQRALKIKPDLAPSLMYMSTLMYDRQDYFKARAYLQRFEDAAEHTPASLWLGIRIERELGDKNALGSYILLLNNKFPESEEARAYKESK